MSELTNKWKSIRISKEYHEKLQMLSIFKEIKMARLIQEMIEIQYSKYREQIIKKL